MAFGKNLMLVFLLMTALFGASLGAVHNVGDSAGWTIMGNVDYDKWATTKTFHVGDSLLFVYNNQFHDVKQVTHQEFLACNATSPVATYTSGSDSVVLKRQGHYYFLCSYSGHCEAGQKVDVLVKPANLLGPTANPATAPAATASTGPSSDTASTMAPELQAQNGAVSASVSGFSAAAISVLVVFVVGLM